MDTQVYKIESKGDVWNKVLRAALAMPGARVERAGYLRKELSKHVPTDCVDSAIETSPVKAGISAALILQISESSIALHRTGVTATSIAAGLPGGWWMAATVPGDLTQFFWHVAVVLQKLAYLHGWPEILRDGEELDDDTLQIFTLFVGVMFGVAGASELLSSVSKEFSKQIVKRLPEKALTKWGLYRLAKEIAKWIGIRLTKTTFARGLSKVIPVVGGVVSGLTTWISFSRMSAKLRRHLERMHLHTGDVVR